MPLLSNSLSVWEIAHRWAELGPSPFRLWIPLAVRDNCRLMMDAILHGRLHCDTLSLNKWSEEDGEEMRPLFVRHHLSKVEACIEGIRFDRDLLRWARIERWAFVDWCERQGIPLPTFWFPPGWNVDFQWPEAEEEDASQVSGNEIVVVEGKERSDQRRRIACQEIAKAIWKEHPETTITAMASDPTVRKYGGGMYQAEDTVRRWLSAVAPPEVKEKRGRPRKKATGDDE
jgi:hypothetical protein